MTEIIEPREMNSPSEITSFLFNYKQWYDRYVLGKEQDDNIYFASGHATHSFNEDFFTEEPKDDENISQFATRRFSELFTKYIDNSERITKMENDIMNKDIIKEYLTKYIQVWVEETKRLEGKYGAKKAFEYNSPEWKEYHAENKELKIHGYVDACFTKDKFHKMSNVMNTMLSVVPEDYKTSSKTRTTFHTEYYIQLMIYALLLQEEGHKVEWLGVDYLKYCQKYYFRVDAHNTQQIKWLINVVQKKIKEVYELAKEDSEAARDFKHKIKIEKML